MLSITLLSLITLFPSFTTIQTEANSCDRPVYDTVTGNAHDYLYKPGEVITINFRTHECPGVQSYYIWCNPEKRDKDQANLCKWTINGDEAVRNVGSGIWSLSNIISPSQFVDSSGCKVKAALSPAIGANTENFTCEMYSSDSGRRTKMTYIFYKLSVQIAHGDLATFARVNETQFANEGDRAELQCNAYIAKGIYSISMEWYLESADGFKSLEGKTEYTAKPCSNRGDRWSSILIIEKVTRDMFNSTYRCVLTKVDLNSLMSNANLSDFPLKAEDMDEPILITTRNSLQIQNISNHYTVVEEGCTRSHPCISENFVTLVETPKNVKVVNGTALALAINAVLIIIITVVIVHLYRRRTQFMNGMKHKWGITADIEDKSYPYHISLFYADYIKEEEEFLQNELIVLLENTWKYKVHLLERNSGFGEGKADMRLNAIDSSRKCLFLLTEDIFTDDWMQFALYSSMKHHQKVVIIKRTDLDFKRIMNEIEQDGENTTTDSSRTGEGQHSSIESAMRVTKLIDWNTTPYKWEKLQYQLPLLIGSQKRHKLTEWIRSILRYKRTHDKYKVNMAMEDRTVAWKKEAEF